MTTVTMPATVPATMPATGEDRAGEEQVAEVLAALVVPAPAEPPQWWVADREQLATQVAELAQLGARLPATNGPELLRLAWAIRVKVAAVQLLAARVASDVVGGGRPW